MASQILAHHKKDGLLVIEVPSAKNRTEVTQLTGELRDLCTDTFLDPDIRVIILTGMEENSFSIDPEMAGFGSEEEEETEGTGQSPAEAIGRLDVPVIAAIQGDATGQGLELVLACDIRIASEGSHFGMTHLRKCLLPQDGGTQRLPRILGRAKAMEMILTGAIIEAREAFRIGLVNRVVPPEKLMETVSEMAKEMASKGPMAMRYAKEAIYKGMDMTLEQGLRLEADLYLLLHTTRDRTEGIHAFRSKKTPQFKGE